MWLDGEAPILVAIRRKSADPLTNAPGYAKVSYKIDINELVSGQNWHGLRAVSLDNGDDQDVVSEGLAWYLHRQASGPEGYGYNAGLASWVRLVINGVDTGVYVNAEQRDKRFLENRGLWVERRHVAVRGRRPATASSWTKGPGDSPTFMTLCYSPFASPSSCATPNAATLGGGRARPGRHAGPARVGRRRHVQPATPTRSSRTARTSISPITSRVRRRACISHGTSIRPWAAEVSTTTSTPRSSPYSDILLDVPEFRAQYTQILNEPRLRTVPAHGSARLPRRVGAGAVHRARGRSEQPDRRVGVDRSSTDEKRGSRSGGRT